MLKHTSPIILAILAAALAGPRAVEKETEGARLIRSDASAVTFEITVPAPEIERTAAGDRVVLRGYGTFSPPGAVELPARTFNVAVPAAGEPSISWTVSESEDLGPLSLSRAMAERAVREGEEGYFRPESFLPDDPTGGVMQFETVFTSPPAMMGRQRVLPVRVMPLTFSGGRYVLARKIRVSVTFGSSVRSDPAAGERIAPRALSGAWRRIYEKALVNPDDTERFIAPPAYRPALRAPAAPGRRLRLKIPETGVYSVRADSLIAMGLSTGLSNDGFALKKLYFDGSEPDLEREKDIPYRVIKGDGSAAGTFSADDRLVFFARAVQDDSDAGDTSAVFNTYNVVWLIEDEAGPTMQDGPGFPSGAGAPQSGFDHVEKIRWDTWYHKFVRAGQTDFNFVAGPERNSITVPFEARDVYPGTLFSLRMRLLGNESDNPHQDLTFELRNGGGTWSLGTGYISETQAKTFDFADIPADRLAEGTNEIVVASVDETYGFLVNDMSVTYRRGISAYEDYLDFICTPVDFGNRRVEMPGFTGQEGFVVELTDPDAPLFHAIPPEYFVEDGGTYKLDMVVPGTADRRLVAMGLEGGMHLSNALIEQVDRDAYSLRSSPGPYTTLVIAHPDFLPPASDHLMQYVGWRESQGYRILTADVNAVYDEFDGGLISPDAIRRFIRYGVDTWGVEFVLLVGDGSEDHRGMFYLGPDATSGSGPDYVPSYTYSVSVIGRDQDEVIASDRYYTFLDEAPPSGYGSPPAPSAPGFLPAAAFPDVIVGRLPVGREIELRALLTKMYRFEEPENSDAWRRSVLLFADDAWSGYLSSYDYNSVEHHFEYGMEDAADRIEEALPGGFDVQKLYLSSWTDGVHDEYPGGGSNVLGIATDSTRRYFTPYLNRRLNEGALFFSFQGHASRSNFATEAGFSNFNQYQDVDSLYTDRNHIFFGVGCHISDFALMNEYSMSGLHGPYGDCITEQLLFKSRAGAVGTYASTAYEYLFENKAFCTTVHEVIFQRPPTDQIPPGDDATGARWILGEMFTAAEIEHLGLNSYSYDQVFRYVLLGDPMLRVEPGPPLMTVSADWGDGMVELEADTLRSRNATNTCSLMFSASDVVALGAITLEVDGEDRTGQLTVVPARDETLDHARGYEARIEYTVSLDERSLVFRTWSLDSMETGRMELHVSESLRLFAGGTEVQQGGDAPAEGDFLFDMTFPVWLSDAPVVKLDGQPVSGASVTVPDPQDSTRWQASFRAALAAGDHLLTAEIGGWEAAFPFSVGGTGLVMEAFNFPNPFSDGTNICYSLNIDADAGTIKIFNVSGVMIRDFVLSRDSLGAAHPGSPNAIWWDGRDSIGDRVANGTYIYVIDIEKDGTTVSYTGKAVCLE